MCGLIASDGYRAQLREHAHPPVARRLLAASMLTLASGHPVLAMELSAAAAWSCDDAEAAAAAVECRLRTAGLLKRLIASSGDDADGMMFVLLADLYRRAGDFEAAIVAVVNGFDHTEDHGAIDVLEFERSLARRGDSAGHAIQGSVHRRGRAQVNC